MVKLRKIECERVHGRITGEWDFTGPTCIVGPNMAGKSTLLALPLAVMLSEVGRLGAPPAPARIAATFELDGAKQVHGVTYGPTETTAWYRDGRVAAARTSAKERQAVIGAASMWDVSEFLRSSVRERTSWLAANAGAEEWTAADVMAAVDVAYDGLVATAREEHAKVAARAEKRGEDAPAFEQPLGGSWRNLCADNRIPTMVGAESGARWIERVTEAVKAAAATKQRQKLDDERGVVDDEKKLAELEGSLPPGTVARWTEQADDAVRRAAAFAAQIEHAASASRAITALEDKISRIARAEGAARSELDAILLADPVDLAALEASSRAANEQEVQAVTKRDEARTESQALAVKLDDERKRFNRAESAANKVSAERDAAGAFAPVVDAARGVLAAWDAEDGIDEIAATWPSLAEAIVSLREAAASAPTIPTEVEIEKARADLVAFRAAGAKLSESTRSAQRRVDALDADVVAARDVARKAHAAFQDARTKAKASEDRAAELRRKLAELAVEREEAVTARSEATPAADVSELRNQVAALEAEARTARTNALRLGNAANAQAALAKRRQQARESEAAAKSLRALVDLIAAARVALLEISRDPIAEVATDIAQRVIGARIKVEGGDIRIIRDAVSYSVDTASDAERVVVLMAFALAVRMRLPGWRPVFVDRLDALEPALRERFATVLRELLAEGKIDNLVIALHGDASVAPPGFNVIELPGA